MSPCSGRPASNEKRRNPTQSLCLYRSEVSLCRSNILVSSTSSRICGLTTPEQERAAINRAYVDARKPSDLSPALD